MPNCGEALAWAVCFVPPRPCRALLKPNQSLAAHSPPNPPAGSVFLGALAAAPALVESLTGLQAFRGFAGTSVLILVGGAHPAEPCAAASCISSRRGLVSLMLCLTLDWLPALFVALQVGVATDTARRFRSELAMQKYRDIDKLYDDLKP